MLSNTEENYLKGIYHISENGSSSISTNAISEVMDTSAASVTTMIKKLSKKKLVNYKKYQGVTLTEEGKRESLKLIRKHRLWETFLVNKLKFKWDEVHDMAEQLEHIKSPSLIDRIDEFLGNPKLDPHGDPIPDMDGNIEEIVSNSLSEVECGTIGTMAGVKNSDPQFLQYLERIGIMIGSKIEVIDKVEFDDSLEIVVDSGDPVFISKEVSHNLLIV